MSFLTWWYWTKVFQFISNWTHICHNFSVFTETAKELGPWLLVLWFPGSPSIKLHLGFFIKFDISKVATGGIKEFMHHLNFFIGSIVDLMHLLVSAEIKEPDTCTYIHSFLDSFPYRSLQRIRQSSLCYTEVPVTCIICVCSVALSCLTFAIP